MARAPLQVLVLPFRQLTGDDLAFAVFRRSDDSAWQGLAGGGEGSESPIEAARREAREEAGIPPTTPLYLLEMMDFVPVTCFSARAECLPTPTSFPNTSSLWTSVDKSCACRTSTQSFAGLPTPRRTACSLTTATRPRYGSFPSGSHEVTFSSPRRRRRLGHAVGREQPLAAAEEHVRVDGRSVRDRTTVVSSGALRRPCGSRRTTARRSAARDRLRNRKGNPSAAGSGVLGRMRRAW